jgi:hypothetical protein
MQTGLRVDPESAKCIIANSVGYDFTGVIVHAVHYDATTIWIVADVYHLTLTQAQGLSQQTS